MRTVFTSLLLLAAAFVSNQAVAVTSVKEITFKFSESDFKFFTNDYGELEIQSTNPDAFEAPFGTPSISMFPCEIEISNNQSYIASEISVSEKRLLFDNVRLPIVPYPVLSDAGSVESSSKTTETVLDGVFPDVNCKYLSSSYGAINSSLHFIASPFVYDASSQQLFFIDSMTVKVYLRENETVSENMLKASTRGEPDIETLDDCVKYAIITSTALKDAFQELADWKTQKGVPTKVYTVSSIRQNCSKDSAQIMIKRFIYDLYLNKGLQFVLLGGDDSAVPTRLCRGDSSIPGVDDYDIPTDLYYACFNGSNHNVHDGKFLWDHNHNGIYGELEDSVNLSPSVYLTRLPVRTEQDVKYYIRKLLNYEQGKGAFTNNILLCGEDQGLDRLPNEAENRSMQLYNAFIKDKWDGNLVNFYNLHTYSECSLGKDYEFNNKNICTQFGNGYSFINIFCHGSSTALAADADGNKMLYNLANANSQINKGFSIITTGACSTNEFDSRFDAYCLSEGLLKNPNSGVLSYYGSSRVAFDSPSSRGLGSSSRFIGNFYKTLFTTGKLYYKHFGEIIAMSKIKYITNSASNEFYRWMMYSLNPVGDCEMPIFTEVPRFFDNSEVVVRNDSLIIKSGYPRCRICVMSDNDKGKSYYKVFQSKYWVYLTDFPKNCSICISFPGFASKVYFVRHIQNTTYTSPQVVSADIIYIGEDFYSKDQGPVVVSNRFNVTGKEIHIGKGLEIKDESILKLQLTN